VHHLTILVSSATVILEEAGFPSNRGHSN
jgi:hypothetical protein